LAATGQAGAKPFAGRFVTARNGAASWRLLFIRDDPAVLVSPTQFTKDI